jgi:hypothetical protein
MESWPLQGEAGSQCSLSTVKRPPTGARMSRLACLFPRGMLAGPETLTANKEKHCVLILAGPLVGS